MCDSVSKYFTSLHECYSLLWSDLSVGVLHAVVHQHHDEDSNGDPKVSNDPTELRHTEDQFTDW